MVTLVCKSKLINVSENRIFEHLAFLNSEILRLVQMKFLRSNIDMCACRQNYGTKNSLTLGFLDEMKVDRIISSFEFDLSFLSVSHPQKNAAFGRGLEILACHRKREEQLCWHKLWPLYSALTLALLRISQIPLSLILSSVESLMRIFGR